MAPRHWASELAVGLMMHALSSTSREVNGGGAARSASVADTFLDFYLEADMEAQVELINNYWQFLHRCSIGIPAHTFGELDVEMGAWWDWKSRFNDAQLRRWLPFQHDWQSDLDDWADRWRAMYNKLALTPGVAECLGERNVQPQLVEERKAPSLHTHPRRYIWPVVGGLTLLLTFTYVWRRAGR